MIERVAVQEPAAVGALVGRLVVLDDDPTGVQTLAGIRVLLAWHDPQQIAQALAGRPSVHVVTNARALSPGRAREAVAEAARSAARGLADVRFVLRGDSTLRGHLLEEYLGLCDATRAQHPPLLLAPALPSAGRITRDGVHLIERNGRSEPLHDTEYARDGVFAYRSARLLEWADERSHGFFAAAYGRAVPLRDLRAGGAALVASALAELAEAPRPGVLVVDSESDGDLLLVALGYAQAVEQDVDAVVRCAPAFAGILAGTTAEALVPVPTTGEGVLVVCGSYVPTSTRQLAALAARWPASLVEVDASTLASATPEVEESRAARAASSALERTGVAILATPRLRKEAELEAGLRIAEGLARTARAVEPRAGVVVAKGGITSAVTLRAGFGAVEADVVGPVLPGVSHWLADTRSGPLDYLVVPGNVGDDFLLAELVSRAARR
jgi:uncharacterized protein YgbK (DUF1537 family)